MIQITAKEGKRKGMQLKEVLDNFKNDKSWNTENKDGTHRFDGKLKWIESMVKSYAEYFEMTEDEVITIMEEHRTYSWPNYYQECNFPDVEDFDSLAGIFKTYEDFSNHVVQNWGGFKCPKGGSVSMNPQECIHRIRKDKKCDWAAYGLFESGIRIIILENGFKTIPIFEPVLKTDDTNPFRDSRFGG